MENEWEREGRVVGEGMAEQKKLYEKKLIRKDKPYSATTAWQLAQITDFHTSVLLIDKDLEGGGGVIGSSMRICL